MIFIDCLRATRAANVNSFIGTITHAAVLISLRNIRQLFSRQIDFTADRLKQVVKG